MFFIDLLKSKFVSFSFFSLCISLNTDSFCQIVNIENKRIYDDTLGWSGALDGGFSAFQNQDLLLNANFRPRVQCKTSRHYFLFLTDWFYSKSPDKVFANSGMVHLRYAWRLKSASKAVKSPWKWESYAQVQYNQLLDQRIRALVGSGFRVKAMDKKECRIFAGTSTLYEYEEIRSSGLLNKNLRWSNYLSCFFSPKPNFSFSAVTYFQPLWKNFSDFRIMGQYAFNINIFKRTDLRFEVNQFFDSNPPPAVRKFVFTTMLGVHVRLGE
jgi:hypothetical protein